VRFQTLLLPSPQSETPLAPNLRVYLKYVPNVNRVFCFSYSDPDYPTYRSTLTGLMRMY
jgi:hypothetical protein